MLSAAYTSDALVPGTPVAGPDGMAAFAGALVPYIFNALVQHAASPAGQEALASAFTPPSIPAVSRKRARVEVFSSSSDESSSEESEEEKKANKRKKRKEKKKKGKTVKKVKKAKTLKSMKKLKKGRKGTKGSRHH